MAAGHENTIEARKRALAKGHKPHTTPHQRRLYFKLRNEGLSQENAGKKAGVSRSTAARWDKSVGGGGAVNDKRLIEAPPDPIAYDDLSDEARRGIEDFGYFVDHFLDMYAFPWWEIGAKELIEAYESEDDEYLVVNVHPGSGKSTWITFAFAIWVCVRERALGHEPRILLGHKTEKKAKRYLYRVARTLTQNARLLEAYGRFKPNRIGVGITWSTEELLVEPLVWEELKEKEPTFSIGSQEGNILSVRYTLMICDDWIDLGNQSTVDQRENVEWKWEQEVESRLEPGGLLIMSAARVGPEDLAHWLLSRETEDDDGAEHPTYRRLVFKAHYEDRCRTDGSFPHWGPWPQGCILNPLRLAKVHDYRTAPQDETLWRRAWRRLSRVMSNEDQFALVWQQEDTDPTGSLAERPWFEGGQDSRGRECVGCYDTGRLFGQRRSADNMLLASFVTVDPSDVKNWGIIHHLLYPGDELDVYRMFRGPLKAPDLLYREQPRGKQVYGDFTGLLEDWWQLSSKEQVPFRFLVMESVWGSRFVRQYPFFSEWAIARGVTLLNHDTNRTNKADPHYGVQMQGPFYREGRYRLPYGGTEERRMAELYTREACSWPKGSTDDLVMSSWFGIHKLPQVKTIMLAEDLPNDESVSEPWLQELAEVPDWIDEMAATW